MYHALTVLFRRDPSRDRRDGPVPFEGYEICWPDGTPVAVSLEAFCLHGQRLLGLGRQLHGCQEKLIEMICFPQPGREADMTRLPGHRVRRFFIERTGSVGRIHFMDGTPTAIVLEVGRDEAPVLHWIGLPQLRDGERQWFDLAARTVQTDAAPPAFPAFTNRGLEQLA